MEIKEEEDKGHIGASTTLLGVTIKGKGGIGALVKYAFQLASKPTKTVQKEAMSVLNKLNRALDKLKSKAGKSLGEIGKQTALQAAYDTLHGEYCKHFKC
jgi:hypothetical protein